MQVFPSAREYSRLADDTGFVAVTNDATDGRITDDTLRKSREWFRAIFEQAAVGMAEVDLEGRWIRVNDRLCDMLGYTRDELLAMTFWGLTHPDDLAAELAHFQRLLADELATVTMEKRYLHRNSSHLWVSSTLSPVRDQAGNLQYFIAVVEDISRRKLVETALRESEQRFRRLFDDAPLPSYLIDLSDAAIVDCNAAAATMLGYERDALRRMRVPDIEAATEEGDLVAREPVMGGPV
jgi:PAS domain S-box-containing protein